ncbi:ABC transporter permease [Leptospirillum ferriphilum]|uniref:ABC transporter permease n=1 Tax=Leptospirillum ferriphilum TaxID=178606 RepID=UPI003EE4D35C
MKPFLIRVLRLAQKEFLALLRDKKSRMVLIVPPLVQLIVFSYAATFDLNHISYAVWNEDPGLYSRQLLARFSGSPNFRLTRAIRSETEVRNLIDNRKVLLVLHIRSTFSRDLLAGRPGQVEALIDGRQSNTAMILMGYVQTIVSDYNDDFVARNGLSPPIAPLEIRAWYNPNLKSRWFIVPGIVGLLTLVVSLLVTALSVAREREDGTFDQLLVTPLRPVDIILGKILPGFVIGFLESTAIVLVAVFLFHVPLRGSFFALYLGIFLFTLSGLGVGLMISSIVSTQQQGLLGAFLFLVPSIILSGFATPIANMPELIQDLTLMNPLRYFLVILREVFLQGATARILLPEYGGLALIGGTALLLAGHFFRKRIG